MKHTYLGVILAVAVAVGIAYAATSAVQEFRGKYTPVNIEVIPLTYNMGNVTGGDTISYNSVVTNKSGFDVNITNAVQSPSWVVADISGWPAGSYRVLTAKQSITITMVIRIGLPPDPDVDQDFNGSFTFYGVRKR